MIRKRHCQAEGGLGHCNRAQYTSAADHALYLRDFPWETDAIRCIDPEQQLPRASTPLLQMDSLVLHFDGLGSWESHQNQVTVAVSKPACKRESKTLR
jgi:hypothetical protein